MSQTINKSQSQSIPVPLDEVVQKRRATNSFKPDPVPDELLQRVLELASFAPSGYNLQPWRLIVVRDEENRKKLRKAAMNQPKVEEAPVVIIFCGHTTAWREDLEATIELGKELGSIPNDEIAASIKKNCTQYLESYDINIWTTRQTMIMFTHVMLLAEAFGLDTAPMEGFWEDKVREAFNIPKELRVLALMALGYKKGEDRPFAGRFDLQKTISSETFGQPWARGTAI